MVSEIESIQGVSGVHHLHIWSISSKFGALSAHVVVSDGLISEKYQIITEIESKLMQRFGINHPTIQLETDACRDQSVIVNINNHQH